MLTITDKGEGGLAKIHRDSYSKLMDNERKKISWIFLKKYEIK